MKYCYNCNQWIKPKKHFHGCLFVFLLFTVFGWIIYLITYGLKNPHCPICNATNYGSSPPPQQQRVMVPQPVYYVPAPQTPSTKIYCRVCGVENISSFKYCASCGSLLQQLGDKDNG